MKTPVTIRVAVQDDWDAGTGLQVFTDRGSGTVDENAPLLGKPKAVFPGALAAEGYGAQPYGVGAYGANTPDAPRSGGYGDRVYGEADYGTSEPYVEVTANETGASSIN